MSQPLATIPAGPDEEIRFSLREARGHALIDIRMYYLPPQGEPIPTRKGLTFPPDLLPRLKKAVLALEDPLVEHRLLGGEAATFRGGQGA